MSRIVTKFKTVKPDRFIEMYEENENIMPC